jgi:hypothetical protein
VDTHRTGIHFAEAAKQIVLAAAVPTACQQCTKHSSILGAPHAAQSNSYLSATVPSRSFVGIPVHGAVGRGRSLDSCEPGDARRKSYDLHKATGSPIAAEALRRNTELYAIEREATLPAGRSNSRADI